MVGSSRRCDRAKRRENGRQPLLARTIRIGGRDRSRSNCPDCRDFASRIWRNRCGAESQWYFSSGISLLFIKRRRSPRSQILSGILRRRFREALHRAENPKWRKNAATRYPWLLEALEGNPDRGIAEPGGALKTLSEISPAAASSLCGVVRTRPDGTSLAGRRHRRRTFTQGSLASCQVCPRLAKARPPRRSLGRGESAARFGPRLRLGRSGPSRLIARRRIAGRGPTISRSALDLSPGDTGALAVQAEIHLATGDLAAAEVAINAVANGLKANPFWFMNNELAELEKKLAESPRRENIRGSGGCPAVGNP